MTANGKAEIRNADPRVMIQDLSANIAAAGISAKGKNYGDLKLTASTEGGKVNFALASNLGGSSIQGHGSAQIAKDYPVDTQLTFSNVTWARLGDLIRSESAEPANFDVATDGQVSVHGPVLKADELRGSIQLSKLVLSSIPAARGAKPVTLQNQGADFSDTGSGKQLCGSTARISPVPRLTCRPRGRFRCRTNRWT